MFHLVVGILSNNNYIILSFNKLYILEYCKNIKMLTKYIVSTKYKLNYV